MPGCLSLFSLCPVRCFLPSLRLINCLSISLCPICCYTLSLCTISRLPLSSLYPLFSLFSFHYQLPYYFFPLHLLSSISLRHIGFLFPLLSALYRPVIILTRFKAANLRSYCVKCLDNMFNITCGICLVPVRRVALTGFTSHKSTPVNVA